MKNTSKAAILIATTLAWGAAPAVAHATGGGQDRVGICHRNGSETNPYVYIEVPAAEANGHITGTDKSHNVKVTWKSDGTWRGVPHHAGDPKPDYYASGPADCEDTATTTTSGTSTVPPTATETSPSTSSTTTQPSETTTSSSSTTTGTPSSSSTSSSPTSTSSTTTTASSTTGSSSPTTSSEPPTSGTSSSSSTTRTTRTYTGTARPSPTTSTSSPLAPVTSPPGSTSGTPGQPTPSNGLLAYTGYDSTLTLVWGLMLLLLGIASIAASRKVFAVERHH